MSLSSSLQPLNLDPTKLTKLTLDFHKVFKDLGFNSSQQFLPTPITLTDQSLDFDGPVLAIDVGGSHLRVGLYQGCGDAGLELLHGGEYQVIPEEIKAGTAEGLFSFIGKHIVDVLVSYQSTTRQNGSETRTKASDLQRKDLGASLPVGVTFSFPMIQHSINEAVLMPLGKGFTMTPGQKLDELLLAGYEEHAGRLPPSNGSLNTSKQNGHSHTALPKLVIKAITNDTIATLVAGRYFHSPSSNPSSTTDNNLSSPQDIVLGLILATGMNATIPLPLSALSSDKASTVSIPSTSTTPESDQHILINTELSISGTSPPLRSLNIMTPWDVTLDAETASPGFQPLEYMTSGRYLGELARIVFVDWLVRIQKIDSQTLPPRLLAPWTLTTEYLSTVVAVSNSTRKLAGTLERDFPPPSPFSEPLELAPWKWTPIHAETLTTIAQTIQIRSSRLIASCIIALLLLCNTVHLKSSSPTNTNTTIQSTQTKAKEPSDVVIAYTGAVIEKYPMYLATCQEAVDALFFSLCACEEGVERIVLTRIEEGGLRGAAVLAGREMGRA